MSITREELEVNKEYVYDQDKRESYIRRVTAIGEFTLIGWSRGKESEDLNSIEWFLNNYSLPPKPKEKITIVEFIDRYGCVYKETLEYFNSRKHEVMPKIIRQYEVEVSNGN